jgi:CheY-like chemotaxis protein
MSVARVLVVDDDPDLLALIEIQLKHHKHIVATASSGPDALKLVVETGAPDVAVLDVAMPAMNGFELFHAFRELPIVAFPIVFLSARVTPRDVEAGRALDAIYLTKPYVMKALLEAIDKSLESTSPSGEAWPTSA